MNLPPQESELAKITGNFSTNRPVFLTQWEPSGWVCYLFGNRPGGMGLVYKPAKGSVPNCFVRWMMLVTLDCLWVKEGK